MQQHIFYFFFFSLLWFFFDRAHFKTIWTSWSHFFALISSDLCSFLFLQGKRMILYLYLKKDENKQVKTQEKDKQHRTKRESV